MLLHINVYAACIYVAKITCVVSQVPSLYSLLTTSLEYLMSVAWHDEGVLVYEQQFTICNLIL